MHLGKWRATLQVRDGEKMKKPWTLEEIINYVTDTDIGEVTLTQVMTK